MLHTHEVPLSNFLEEFMAGKHLCCTDAATSEWLKVMRSEKFQDFFVKLVMNSCLPHLDNDHEMVLEFNSLYAPIVLKLVVTCLSLGTVAGISTIYQASKELEKVFNTVLKESEPLFVKRGPQEQI